ncbi:hypothetical protein ORV05_04705 [Amycolatopsis cynarae]|uniref:Uncharacterized protein n=1 Tax=Amycolatopsis cynarae TaxID=2995223 RepID=A0ABY7B437_9PSEU|nr:hypothetical protein [Amycolatopsis sp. HUAS 11-8]WAL67091.1 hypothetical protein ORV05_04705 [Amycolatopsis sp. HUAS 11-8]
MSRSTVVSAACPKKCRRCKKGPLVGQGAEGGRKHVGRGLCSYCWELVAGTDKLFDYPRLTRFSEETYFDWQALLARDPALKKREGAALLGISYAALDRALTRYRRRLREENGAVA